MLRFLNGTLASFLIVFLFLSTPTIAQDIAKGEKVFKKCRACHTVGDGAKNKVGPHLNELFGRKAAGLEDFKYSKAMQKAGGEGLVWDDVNLDQFLAKPKKMIKKTKMAFAGLKKENQRVDLIAYLKTFTESATQPAKEEGSTKTEKIDEAKKEEPKKVAILAKDQPKPTHGNFHLGRKALSQEIQAWNIDIRPDGLGLPVGQGSVSQGEPIYVDNCAVCHGDFGEGIDRWPILAGGFDTLTEDRPEKTIGSYWPYLSTVFDYVKRAMPFGNARSLSDDDVYALTAYLLYLNDVVTEEDFELSNENFKSIRLPNEQNFVADNRSEEPHYKSASEPCMRDCIPGKAKVTMRARVLDVTPDAEGEGSLE